MDYESIRERLGQIIADDTGLDSAVIDPVKPIREQVALDSMQFVGLIAKVECAFDIELPLSILQISTLGEFYTAVESTVALHEGGPGN